MDSLVQEIQKAFAAHSNAITAVSNDLKGVFIRLLRAEYMLGMLSAKDLTTTLTQLYATVPEEQRPDQLAIVQMVEDFNKLRDCVYTIIRETKCEKPDERYQVQR